MKFMKFSLKVSLKYFNEIFTRQNFMKFSISDFNRLTMSGPVQILNKEWG